MKKSSKILGSIALSAALVMGTAAPAFAAEGDPVSTPDGEGNATVVGGADDKKQMNTGAATTITASTYTSQINVTIPLVVPLQFDTVGGRGIAPSPNVYYIQNNSSSDITVVKATFDVPTAAQKNWNLADAVTDPTNENTKTAPTLQGDVEVGSYFLNIHSTATTNGTPTDLALKGDATSRTSGSSNLNWGIQAHKMWGFQLDAFSSKLNKDIGATPESIASISYTVQVGEVTGAAMGATDSVSGAKTTINSMKEALTEGNVFTGKAIKDYFTTGTNGASYAAGDPADATAALAATTTSLNDDGEYEINSVWYGTTSLSRNGADVEKHPTLTYKVFVTDVTPAASGE